MIVTLKTSFHVNEVCFNVKLFENQIKNENECFNSVEVFFVSSLRMADGSSIVSPRFPLLLWTDARQWVHTYIDKEFPRFLRQTF